MELSITEKLAALRESKNLSPKSDILTTPFPIKSLLHLYSKNRNELYLNYFQGFKILIDWLSPIESPEISNCIETSWFEGNYEVDRLSVILGIPYYMTYAYLKDIYGK